MAFPRKGRGHHAPTARATTPGQTCRLQERLAFRAAFGAELDGLSQPRGKTCPSRDAMLERIGNVAATARIQRTGRAWDLSANAMTDEKIITIEANSVTPSPSLKALTLAAIAAHIQIHGRRNWDLVREDPRFAAVIGKSAGEAGRRKLFRWVQAMSEPGSLRWSGRRVGRRPRWGSTRRSRDGVVGACFRSPRPLRPSQQAAHWLRLGTDDSWTLSHIVTPEFGQFEPQQSSSRLAETDRDPTDESAI